MQLAIVLIFGCMHIVVSFIPIVATYVDKLGNEEEKVECKPVLYFIGWWSFYLITFPAIAYIFLKFLRFQDSNLQQKKLALTAISVSSFQIVCIYMRIQGELTFNNPNARDFHCFSAFIEFYCLFILKICLVFMGAIWFSIMALFLQYGFRSSSLKRKLGTFLSLSTWIVLGLIVHEMKSKGELGKCAENLGGWASRALINIAIFLTLYFLCMSYDEVDRFGIHLKIVTSLFLKLFIPFNLFGYIEAVSLLTEIRQHTPDCIIKPHYLYLEIAVYEWVLFSTLFIMAACAVMLRCRLLTIEQICVNPFLTLLGLSEEEVVEDSNRIRFNETYATFLITTAIDCTKHTSSFFEKTACPICWDPYTTEDKVVYFPGCDHVFHDGCIKAWVRAHSTCPTCRRSLPIAVEMTEIPHYTRF